jgi:hypothetical protein
MEQKVLDLLERGVTALEKLGEEPVFQMETGPPVCPHCERMNPSVTVKESEESGPLAEFVIKCICGHCHQTFFAIPLQWSMCQNIQEVEAVIRERAEISGYHS